MKRSGRTLKQRLYGLKHITKYLSRARHFRGHGVHSPYVYNIVRKVFMRSELYTTDHSLYDALIAIDTPRRRAIQLQNLVEHCAYQSWSIDSLEQHPFIIATTRVQPEELSRYNDYARECGATLCIMAPYECAERWRAASEIIEAHHSTTIDNRGYLLIFNNHLPKQKFRL